ncbi:MAG: hypothetical protein KatS3mg099_400 [Candidatus Parcubacteria bacterium]|nr:MAG: hypothetical protein KatS3mg099_400 [Candidatus Parcubacteria bacterium]
MGLSHGAHYPRERESGHPAPAFTLIELLVVIAIIGLLSSIVFASVNSAREKARVARAAADLKEITKVLAIYYDDNNNYPCFDHNWSDARERSWAAPYYQWPKTRGARSITGSTASKVLPTPFLCAVLGKARRKRSIQRWTTATSPQASFAEAVAVLNTAGWIKPLLPPIVTSAQMALGFAAKVARASPLFPAKAGKEETLPTL